MTQTHQPYMRSISMSEIDARFTQCVRLASDNLRLLDEHSRFWDDDHDSLVRLVDKILIESALLLLLARRAPATHEGEQGLIELESEVTLRASNERSTVMLMRFPQTVTSLGIPITVLRAMGRNVGSEVSKLVDSAWASGIVEATERLPFRSMDVEWLRSIHEGSEAGWREAKARDFGRSILEGAAHPIYMTRADGYAVTHSIMYLTDFGTLRLPGSVDYARATSLVEAGIAWNLRTGDMDLLAEFVVAALYIRRGDSPYAVEGLRSIFDTWNRFNFLPGPSFDPQALESQSDPEARAYAYRHLYHTNYVGGLLCAELKHCRSNTALRPAGQTWTPNRSSTAPAPEVELDSEIIFAIRNYDLSSCLDILESATVAGRWTVSCNVAADFLRRQEVGGLLGAHFLNEQNRKVDELRSYGDSELSRLHRLAATCN